MATLASYGNTCLIWQVLVEKLGMPGVPPPPDSAAAADHYGAIRASEYARIATLEFSRERKVSAE